MPTAEDIKDRISKIEDSSAEAMVKDRIASDFGLWRGDPFNPGDDYEAFTDNTPQSQAGKTIAALATAKLSIFCPIDIDKKKARKDKSISERFVNGYIDSVNLILRRRGEPDLQSQVAWYAINTGFIIAKPLIYKGKNGTKIGFELWNRINVSYEMGVDGLKWIACKRSLSPGEIYALYGVTGDHAGDQPVDVIDYFDDEENGLIIDDKFYKALTKHQIGFNPVIFLPCGSTPYVSHPMIQDAYKDVGESIYKDLRNLVKPNNVLLSAVLTQAYRFRKPPIAIESADGTYTVEQDPYKSGAKVPLSKNKQQDIRPLEMPELPKDMYAASEMVASKLAQALPEFPWSGVQGNSPWSGLALSVAAHTTGTVIYQFKKAMEAMYEEIAWNVTRMFSESWDESNLGLEPIELAFNTEQGMSIHNFKPSEVKPFRFKAELEIELPQDEMQKWMQARIASEKPQGQEPILSMQTIREQIIKVQDPDSERAKILEEWAMNLPTVRLREVLLALIERLDKGDMEAIRAAKSIAMELDKMEQLQLQDYMKTIMGQTPGQMGAAAPQPNQSPDQGMTPKAGLPMGGMPPGAAPPQALSPGLMMPPEQEMMMQAMMTGMPQ
jgi:hypothetical protein